MIIRHVQSRHERDQSFLVRVPMRTKNLVPVPARKNFRSRSGSLQKQILIPVPVKKILVPVKKKKFGPETGTGTTLPISSTETESLGLGLGLLWVSELSQSRSVSFSVLSRVPKRLTLCLSCFRFASYEHFCRFFGSFDEKSSFSLIILAFKENLKNLASSTSKICQLTRFDKKAQCEKNWKNQNPEERGCPGHGRRLMIITRWQASHWIVSS
jgi:hypothetical protein